MPQTRRFIGTYSKIQLFVALEVAQIEKINQQKRRVSIRTRTEKAY